MTLRPYLLLSALALTGACSDDDAPARADVGPDAKLPAVDAATDMARDAHAADLSPDLMAPDLGPDLTALCLDGGASFSVDAGGADGGCVLNVPACCGQPNLLRNGSFEDVPDSTTGQGVLPSEWLQGEASPGADTFSTDGSYGLQPGTSYGHFPSGLQASAGGRWVAGWSAANEHIGQQLTQTLAPGVTYRVSGALYMSHNIANPGTYDVWLQDAMSVPTQEEMVGTFCPIDAHAWEPRSFTFVAPANAASLPYFVFRPTPAGSSGTYPGLDDVSLTAMTACGI